MSEVPLFLLILAAVLALPVGAVAGLFGPCDLPCAPNRTKDVLSGGRVGGFVDSGPEMPMPSAFDRSTGQWTLVDSGGLFCPLLRAARERKGTHAQRGGDEVVHESLLTAVLDGAHTTSPTLGFAPGPFLS